MIDILVYSTIFANITYNLYIKISYIWMKSKGNVSEDFDFSNLSIISKFFK